MPTELLSASLTNSRAALVGSYVPLDAPPTLPPVDGAHALTRSLPPARVATVTFEMLSGLAFEHHAQHIALVFHAPGAAPVEVVRLTRPSAETFRGQLDLVANYAELRDDRGGEILSQAQGALDYVATIVGLSPDKHKRTLEWLSAALSLAQLVEMRFKLGFDVPRPVQLSAQIQPMVPTPAHASWPSGHSTETHLMAALLTHLRPGHPRAAEQLNRLAARVAVNRTVAGLHYPVDSAAGRLLGTSLAEFVVARSVAQSPFHGRHFDGPAYPPEADFDPRLPLQGDDAPPYYRYHAASTPLATSGWLSSQWQLALAEWA
ncbi:phosphatase PAP2 family protein [Curvibacter sp. HBC61]|uniref:Phosphatase PAP2 family protein n=1 Tax=Curvibacter cyanobacteriorum TaxID=3026422 RepID=A0ABT5MU86_9BURK|nr:phosphatase PAP2 family protein [Curvibacter sp. HBC61]MDD0837599.1 phosphatase PAP2 family protein [Curvibacter sp. HBC61]